MAPTSNLKNVLNLAKLARELAQDIYEPDVIRQTNQISPERFDKILADPEFQKMLRGMIDDFNSAAGTAERVKVKAQSAVEAALEGFYHDLTDRTHPLSQRVEALKAMMKLGELGENDAVGGSGVLGGISVNINLGVPGEGRPPKVITVEAEESQALPPG